MMSTGSGRHDGSAFGAGREADRDFDPFDDLARLLEEPWSEDFPIGAKAPAAPVAAAPRQAGAPALDDAFEAAFAAEFARIAPTPGRRAYDAVSPARAGGFEMADDFVSALGPQAPRLAGPTSPWPARPETAGARTAKRRGPASALEAAIEEEIEDAVRGLSAPMNPRGSAPQRTESFAPERRVARDEPVVMPTAAIDDFDALIASELAVMQQQQPFVRDVDHAAFASSMHALAHVESRVAQEALEGRSAVAGERRETERGANPSGHPRRGRRIGRMLTAGTGLAAMIAGGIYLGGFASGDGALLVADGGPLLIKADLDPVRVAPRDPGGKAVPNQNKAVYERVQSAAVPAPEPQGELRVDAEEPIELAPEEDDASIAENLPGVSFYDDGPGAAVASAAEPMPAPEPVLQPRRVKAITVRPDGTLVTEAGEAGAPLAGLAAGDALVPAAASPIQIASADPADGTGAVPDAVPAASDMMTTSTVPAAGPARPADEIAALPPPADEAAEPAAAPATTEATAAAPTADPASYAGYYVQISSQPTAEAARQSSDSLRGRYAGVLGDHDVVIQSADIPGKGTYHRVRVLAGTQNEATGLCEALKSAGGSCFVSR